MTGIPLMAGGGSPVRVEQVGSGIPGYPRVEEAQYDHPHHEAGQSAAGQVRFEDDDGEDEMNVRVHEITDDEGGDENDNGDNSGGGNGAGGEGGESTGGENGGGLSVPIFPVVPSADGGGGSHGGSIVP